MDSIIWAIKHTMRDIADTGLNCMLTLSLFHSYKQPNLSISMLRGCQQLCRRSRSCGQQRLFPTILLEYHTGYLLRLNGCRPQEWLQIAERAPSTHVPARRAEHDPGPIVRSIPVECG